MPPVVLGGQTYKFQNAVDKKFKSVRNSAVLDCRLGQPATEEDALSFLDGSSLSEEDESFLRDLAACHPKLAGNTILKAFVGLSLLNKREKAYGPDRAVFVKMTSPDGRVVVDSFSTRFASIGAIQGIQRAEQIYYKEMVYDNARRSIEPQIQAFRTKTNNTGCTNCGSGFGLHEIDHVGTFNNLVNSFLGNHPAYLDTNTPSNNKHLFVEEPSRGEFYQYHKEHAVLQRLCKPCHSEKTKADRKRPHV